MDELLSLKWNNHSSTFIQILGAIRSKQKYTDVTLACSGKLYSAHQMVLSTCSDYFREIFDQTDCKNLVIVLKDINPVDVELLLDYMYLGEVSVKQTDLSTLLKAAECLQIKGLAVADDEESSKLFSSTPCKKSSSPAIRRKRKIQDLSDHDDNESQSSNKISKRQTKQSSYNESETIQKYNDPPLKDIEPVLIKEETIPYEPENISIEDVYKEEYSNTENVEEAIDNLTPSHSLVELSTELPEGSAIKHCLDDSSSFPASSFQGEPSEWPGDDSSLNYPTSSDYGPPETSSQAPVDDAQKRFMCSFCSKYFVHRSWLDQHVRIHTGEKPFSCNLCPYRAKQKGSLKSHMLLRHSYSF